MAQSAPPVRRARPLLALALLPLAACGGGDAGARPERPQPRLVLLYATCTLNRDYIRPYGEDVPYTPNLDKFAQESVVFRRHQTEAGQSGIAFASIFSGTQAHKHGIYHHPTQLRDELYLISEAFADAGYEPFFWSGHVMASYGLGYGQGIPPENVNEPERDGKRRRHILSFLQPNDPMFQRVLERLESDPAYKAYLQVNFTVTHGAYHRQLPEAAYAQFLQAYPQYKDGLTNQDFARYWELYHENRHDLQWDFPDTVSRLGLSKEEVASLARVLEVTYRADVTYLDSMFGSTLAQLQKRGLLDQALVAFTADHGETLLREGPLFHWTHGLELVPEVLTVPWMIRSPLHVEAGMGLADYEAVTRSIDVFPTLAGLCNLDLTGRGVEGVDLSPVLMGEEAPPDLLAFSHTTTIGEDSIEDFRSWGLASRYWGSTSPDLIWTRIREGDVVHKLVNQGDGTWGFRVYDLAVDPLEERDLYDPADPEHAAMTERLEGYKQLLVQRFGARSTEMPADALDLLEDMGYVEGGEDEED